MERKVFPHFVTKIDADQGIVEHVFAVFGNVDLGNDILHPGSFTKTIAERGNKVRVLDQHKTDSVMRAVGKPIMIREISRNELPPEVLDQYPEATGGVFARTQFLMDTPEGKGIFTRIKESAIDEWSFAYDALDTDYSKIEVDGREITVRNIRTLKLYEYSPVLFGMNPATSTISAKEQETDDEVKTAVIVPPQEKSFYNRAQNKATNLSKLVNEIESAFYSQFPDIHNENNGTHIVYWVRQVWDEFVVAEQMGTAGNHLWQVNYDLTEDVANFAQPQEWVEVELTPTPKQSSSTPPPEDGRSESPEAGDKQPEGKQAGPPNQAPTSEDLLRLIDIYESELSL